MFILRSLLSSMEMIRAARSGPFVVIMETIIG